MFNRPIRKNNYFLCRLLLSVNVSTQTGLYELSQKAEVSRTLQCCGRLCKHGWGKKCLNLRSVFVNNQLDAKFSSCLFISILYMFRAAMCPSSGELIVSIHLVYVTLYRRLFGVRSSIESGIYQKSYW